MAILIGMAGGMSFNLAIDFFAAAGPLTFGFLHAHLHSWTVVIGLVIILAAGLLVAGWLVDTKDYLVAN